MFLARPDAEPRQLLLQFARRAFAAVGEKEVFLLPRLQPGDELARPGNQLVPVVNHPVHVNDEPRLLADLFDGFHAFRR